MKSPLSLLNPLILYAVDSAKMPEAQAFLQAQLHQQKAALFYVFNHQVRVPAADLFLSAQEQAELATFGIQSRRDQYLVSRWLLKSFLAEVLPISIKEINLVRGELGKPQLTQDQNPDGLDFNISHNSEITIVGLSQGMQIGVDVEKIDPSKKSAAIAARFFKETENKWIQEAVDEAEKAQRFFRIWSMKEAVIKAQGGGVFQNFQEFALQSVDQGFLMQSIQEPWSLSSQWRLFEYQQIPDQVCSVALYVASELGHCGV